MATAKKTPVKATAKFAKDNAPVVQKPMLKAEMEKLIDEQRKKIEELEAIIKDGREHNDQQRKDIEALLAQRKDLNKEIAALQVEKAGIYDRAGGIHAELVKLKEQRDGEISTSIAQIAALNDKLQHFEAVAKTHMAEANDLRIGIKVQSAEQEKANGAYRNRIRELEQERDEAQRGLRKVPSILRKLIGA